MKCRVSCRKSSAGWVLRTESNVPTAAPFVERTVDALAQDAQTGNARLPRPPLAEAARWQGAAHAALCDAAAYKDIDDVYRRVLQNNPRAGEVELLGQYLTAVLLGPNLDILENAGGPVDLRLDFDDRDMQRLPWEMMYGPSDGPAGSPAAPLSARPNRRFAINREVPVYPNRPAPQYEFPLKVLFAAGTKVDAVLRPGAEFLGLLRHLKVPADPLFQGDFISANINLRFLPDGDIDQLKALCDAFQPSVLHLICHGQNDPAGGESRIVMRKRPPGAKEGETKAHPITADELADLLSENGGWLPPIFVLNACYTATGPSQPGVVEDAHLPFAARLVQRGAAIAVGMAGEVADPACQMFTLRFYQALLTQAPVTEAASQARRAVLTAWPAYQQSMEWSRPTLFLGSGMSGAVQFAGGPAFDLVTPAERFRKVGTRPEMLCDRYDMLVAYDRLLRLADKPESGRLMVAFTVDDSTRGLGRTRLLEEFAHRAVLDGFLPCVLRADGDIPKSFLDFSLALSDAINETRRNFDVAMEQETECRLCAIDALPAPPDPARRQRTLLQLRSRLGEMANVPSGAILAALRTDCARLAADVSARTGRPHRVMVLIDEFHRYLGAYGEILKNIDFAGFGVGADPIPVVLNYLTTSLEGGDIQQTLKRLPPELRPELRRFDTDLERETVYRQFLLSEFQCVPAQTRALQVRVKEFFDDLHSNTLGVPIAFLDPKVEGFVEGVKRYSNVLVDADYETVLRAAGA